MHTKRFNTFLKSGFNPVLGSIPHFPKKKVVRLITLIEEKRKVDDSLKKSWIKLNLAQKCLNYLFPLAC